MSEDSKQLHEASTSKIYKNTWIVVPKFNQQTQSQNKTDVCYRASSPAHPEMSLRHTTVDSPAKTTFSNQSIPKGRNFLQSAMRPRHYTSPLYKNILHDALKIPQRMNIVQMNKLLIA